MTPLATTELGLERRCNGCGVWTVRPLCQFCEKTADLIRSRRCVFCEAPVLDQDAERIQGKCGDCLSRNHRSGPATRWLLRQYTKARYATGR